MVCDAPVFQEWRDRLGDIATEELPGGIEMAVAGKRLGIVARFAPKLEPAHEMVGIVRIDAHARGRDIDAMRGLRGIICKAASQPLPRLEDGDLPAIHGAIPCQVRRDHGTGEAAADDCDGRARAVMVDGIHHIEDLLRSDDRAVV